MHQHRNRGAKAICIAIAPLLLAPLGRLAAAEPSRTWHDKSGKFELQAALVKTNASSVELKRADGSVVNVPLEQLSDADRKYLNSPNNATQPANPAAAEGSRADSLVMVAIKRNNDTVLAPGVVIHRDDKEAYVVTDSDIIMRDLPRSEREAILFNRPQSSVKSVTIIWDAPAGRKNVKAESFAILRAGSKWLLAAPAEEMPRPFTAGADVKPIESMPVKVITYEVDSTTSPPSFARVVRSGIIKSVFRGQNGKLTELGIEGEHLGKLSSALLVTEDGAAIGVIGKPAHRSAKFSSGVIADFASEVESLCDPIVSYTNVVRVGDDSKTVVVEFIVHMDDPFGRVRKAQLLVGRPKSPTVANGQPIDAARNEWEKMADVETAVALSHSAPSEEAIARLARTYVETAVIASLARTNINAADPTTWVGRYAPANPPDDAIQLELQCSYEDADGKAHYFEPRPYRLALRVPIPGPTNGLNGQQQAQNPSRPSPKKVVSLITQHTQARGYDRYELSLLPGDHNFFSYEREPAVFSTNGEWLYALDAKDVLHKIKTSNLHDDIVLELGTPCERLGLSKSGLVLNIKTKDCLWIVNPESLEIVREIPLPGVALLATSPASSTLVAWRDKWRNKTPGLVIVDLEKGEIIRQIDTKAGGDLDPGKPIGQSFPFTYFADIKMSRDGKYFFASSLTVRRFRIEGNDLIFEAAARLQASKVSTGKFALSDDGKWVGFWPTGSIFDAQNFENPAILNFGVSSMAFDPKTGNMYVYTESDHALKTLSPRGEKLTEAPISGDRDILLFVNPAGGRFLLWGKSKVEYIDTVIGRISGDKKN